MPPLLRHFAALAAAATLTGGAPGCGGEDVERDLDKARQRAEEIREDVQKRVEDARAEFDRRREQFASCIRGRRIEALSPRGADPHGGADDARAAGGRSL